MVRVVLLWALVEAHYFSPMSVGSTPESADDGAVLILNGVKTLTSSALWNYPDGKIPSVGALSVLVDGARRPRGIVETTRVGALIWEWFVVTRRL